MNKPLLIIRYTIRLALFIGLLIPFMVIVVPMFLLMDFIADGELDFSTTSSIIIGFLELTVWGK
jgi:hypothetical protein